MDMIDVSDIKDLRIGDLIKAEITWMQKGELKHRTAIFKVFRFTVTGVYTSYEPYIRTGASLKEYWPEDSNPDAAQIHGTFYAPGKSLEVQKRDWPVYSRDLGTPIKDGMIDMAVFKLARRKL
jgi:hypothetical protein